MLTRPGQREVSSPVDRLQFATFYGMLGVFLGVMGLAVVLWLSQLLGKIQSLSDASQVLASKFEQLDTRQRLVSDGLMERAGKDPVDFAALYERKTKDVDDAEKRLGNERVKVDGLTRDLKLQVHEQERLTEELAKSEARRAKFEKEAAEAALLRAQVADLEKERDVQQRKIDELEPFFDSDPGKEAQLLKDKLVRTQYMMYGGWALSILLGVSLAASYLLLKPLPTAPLQGEVEADRPTHRIE